LGLFDEKFVAWQSADFDAYIEKKWASRRYNLERARVRHRLISLLEQVAEVAALDIAGEETWTGRDHPCVFNNKRVQSQWAVWCRNFSQRHRLQSFDASMSAERALENHVHIGLVIDHQAVQLVLCLPETASVDLALRPRLDAALAEFEQADDERDVGDRHVRVSHVIDREQAVAGEGGVEEISAWFARHWPLYRAGQWRLDNDPNDLGAQLTALEAETAQARASVEVASPVTSPSRPVIAPARSRTLDPPRPRPKAAVQIPKARPRPAAAKPPASRRHGNNPRQHQQRGSYELGPDKKTGNPDKVEIGVTVQITAGLFSGRRGEVTALDGKQLEVVVGAMKLAMTIDQVELC
jgi:hypothetical protein